MIFGESPRLRPSSSPLAADADCPNSIHQKVLNLLGVRSIHCVIGGSLGGMQALEWALLGKYYVRSVVLIATTARQRPWAIAWAETQCATIKADAKFQGGCYGDDPPVEGLAAARMSAMLSYRTHASFEKRFGRSQANANGTKPLFREVVRNSVPGDHYRDEDGTFSARSYLRYQGEKFNARFDANCYLHLLDKIDFHDITRGRCEDLSDSDAMKEVLGQIQQLALVVGVPTDGLYPLSEQVELLEGMPNATFATLESDDGHDGFLLEGEQLNDLLHTFLAKLPLPKEFPLLEEEQIWDNFAELKGLDMVRGTEVLGRG
jgi:homoserine O-acetyltransferase